MAILLRNGRVLDNRTLELKQADVLIENDRIAQIGLELESPADVEVFPADGKLVLPGLINAHTHGHNNLTRGVGDNWTLEQQLNHSAALLTGRNERDQYVSAAIGAIEMLKSGCTAAYDLFMALPAPTPEGSEAVVRAYADVGLRATLAPAVADIVFYETVPGLLDLLPPDLRTTVEGMSATPTAHLLDSAEEFVRRWDGFAGGRIRSAVAPTIPGQCTDEFLSGCRRVVQEYGVGFHTHLAETKVQVIQGLRRWGMSPTAKLAELGLLSPDFVGAHGVWLTGDDVHVMASAGANVVHNPASNLKLGSGIAPVREMIDAGVSVGLGSDGSTSSDNQNLFEAMHFAALVGNVRFSHDPDRWVSAAEVWKMVTTGSARALGMTEDIGAVAPGRKADLILLDGDSIYLKPMNNVVNTLVYVETGASVDDAFVDGRLIMQRGEVLTVDERKLRDEAQEAAERIRASNPELWTVAAALSPYLAEACSMTVAEPLPINRYADLR